MRVPDEILTHMAAVFVGATSALGITWFASLTQRVNQLAEQVDALRELVDQLTAKNRQLRRRIQDLGGENSEVVE